MKGIKGSRWAVCLLATLLIGLIMLPGCTQKEKDDKDKKQETTVMEAAFKQFKPAYQAVGKNNFWHIDFTRDFKNEDTGETYDYYMAIFDNGAGNPGVEGQIISLDNKKIVIKVDYDLYEGTPGDWKLGDDTLELDYTIEDDGTLVLSNSGSKVEFAEYVETDY
ncbi:MAG: hypothetical protein IIZ34_01945 [Eubacterium sp.]|jgi:hypothetical protein|nr:hypothetical protein [Eubacterium sp.]